MAISKTRFINYIRCPKYVGLSKLKKEGLTKDISLKDYRDEEDFEIKKELLGTMFDEDGNDLVDVENLQLQTMLPYYKKVEELAGSLYNEKFEGTPIYYENTFKQQKFESTIDGVKYICYVDIYNDRKESFDIIEVKATTSRNFLDLGKKITDEFGEKDLHSIFLLDEDGVYKLRDEFDNNFFDESLPEKDYLKQKAKLYNKYSSAGRYVYDLAVQRYIIQQSGKEKKDTKYLLAVLNSNYVYQGENLLEPGENNEEIITFFDFTSITRDYMDKIMLDQRRINGYLTKMSLEGGVGDYCEFKKTSKCKFAKVCFDLPEKDSIITYMGNHFGFKDDSGEKHERFDLINDGKKHMLDIPSNWLTRETNQIQRNCVEKEKNYCNIEKIKAGISELEYPIYHFDFETFPCPLPRFKGEKPYTQSVFQFSLHIERKPGICDKEKDHFEYLAKDHSDCREELIKKMIEYIDVENGGTILVYNQTFEKGRLKELAALFPEYKSKLNKMIGMLFDLMYLVKTNNKFYTSLGFDEDSAKLFNYYNPLLQGSFSIKKVLPCFTNLSYKDLEVGDGMAALTTYATFPELDQETYQKKYAALVEYCKQDTWAMVEILEGLRLIKE